MKHILITGVSTGIGHATAQALVAKGYHVDGSVRRQVDADTLQRELGTQFSPLLFDVMTQRRSQKQPEGWRRR
jgi:NADP-dependent 3-hydroxy acid dehydrogenase YdfG